MASCFSNYTMAEQRYTTSPCSRCRDQASPMAHRFQAEQPPRKHSKPASREANYRDSQPASIKIAPTAVLGVQLDAHP